MATDHSKTHIGALQNQGVVLVDGEMLGEGAGRHGQLDVEGLGEGQAGELGQRLEGQDGVLEQPNN